MSNVEMRELFTNLATGRLDRRAVVAGYHRGDGRDGKTRDFALPFVA